MQSYVAVIETHPLQLPGKVGVQDTTNVAVAVASM